MRTYFPKGNELKKLEKQWYLIDAEGVVLGRLATFVADILSGKNKPDYTPFLDMGDHVIVVNAAKIKVTGNKLEDKIYYHHTGYLGNLKQETLGDALKKYPERVIERAVKGMLPKKSLGRQMYRKLKVYPSTDHPHQAQNPVSIKAGKQFKAINKEES
jgi:large subunit ribosomal protein L13